MFQCSSASRKFLNLTASDTATARFRVSVLFSEPKIPQLRSTQNVWLRSSGFSALQRAENSSIYRPSTSSSDTVRFQCSSASRKFLNPKSRLTNGRLCGFQCSSASRKFLNFRRALEQFRLDNVFQCSSASRKFLNRRAGGWRVETVYVSVLFSEPKNSSITTMTTKIRVWDGVSVLFSEPKIPQFKRRPTRAFTSPSFSALQRAENSFILIR